MSFLRWRNQRNQIILGSFRGVCSEKNITLGPSSLRGSQGAPITLVSWSRERGGSGSRAIRLTGDSRCRHGQGWWSVGVGRLATTTCGGAGLTAPITVLYPATVAVAGGGPTLVIVHAVTVNTMLPLSPSGLITGSGPNVRIESVAYIQKGLRTVPNRVFCGATV